MIISEIIFEVNREKTMDRTKLKGPAFLFGAFTLAGTSVVCARIVSDSLGTFTITALSMVFALLFLLPICGKRLVQNIRYMTPGDWLSTALQALIGIFLFRFLLLNGIARTSAAEAGILTGATPAITAMLAWMLLKERISLFSAAGIAATVCGVLLIQGLLSPSYELETQHFWGNMLVLGAAASESTFNILSRVFAVKGKARQRRIDPWVQTTLVAAFALLLSLTPALFENPIQGLQSVGFEGWLALIWYGVFVTALAFICWYAGINRCPAFMAAAFSGMMPLTAMLLSVTLLGEAAGWAQWIGSALVMLGMALIGVKKKAVSNPVTSGSEAFTNAPE
jgi:drug/metabolite transporter (DMT)-like permease